MRTVAAFTLLCFAGCAHLFVAPLPASPSPDQRIQTWGALHAVSQTETTTCSSRGCSVDDTLNLANGEQTDYPEDLLPLVKPDSPTAAHATRSAHHRTIYRILWLVAVGAAVSAIVTAASAPHDVNNALSTTTKVEVGVGLGVAVAAIVGIGIFHHISSEEKLRAFGSFNKDLGENLRICSYRTMPIPCEQVAPGGAPGESLPPVTSRPTRPSLAMRP